MIMQLFVLTNAERAGAIRFTIGLMVPQLRIANIDLTDMPAVRAALIAAHFGDELIAACAELAAQAAMDPAYA
jgi:hypothetical protein